MGLHVLSLVVILVALAQELTQTLPAPGGHDTAVRELAEEVRGKGWIVFCARSPAGDWDLFACRPDGSDRRNITGTPQYHEAAPQFSRDGCRLLYRRLPRSETLNGNRYGAQGQLVFANSDGTSTEVYGEMGQYPWASWSPDGQQIVCLSLKGASFVSLANRQVVRTLERKGFFQQLTWSPDGQWLSGVANSFGTGWSVARMDATTGAINAVSRVDCCTPDWFPDGRHLIFSNRPPGQKGNDGNGWTQLWRADAQGKTRQLVYGEDGRHVYGGHISPDGKYVLFTGNLREDGDPENAGAPMGLMRLADTPIIGGDSKELRGLHPDAKNGPVLVLPVGWEPCWTSADLKSGDASTPTDSCSDDVAKLAAEVREKGWLMFGAATDSGDWDLFAMRPDGSQRRKITDTREYNEAGAKFSWDGKKLLYYRMPKSEKVDNNTYGTYELVVAETDGGNAVVYGRGFSWASWGPDGTQIACLDKKGIQIVDLASRQVVRQIPRSGIVQQLVWSPSGKQFVGTANGLGVAWTIGCSDAQTGHIHAVSETDRYNCTPDWLPDSEHIIYSRGIVPGEAGWAQLWMAKANGADRQLLYAEPGQHLYGGCVSPDGQYVLFTRSEVDLGKVDNSRTRMGIIRRRDAPMIGGADESLRREFPSARHGPLLDLGWGWEPSWTFGLIMDD
jgi:Tol biopolymer transport system component